jgi:23S rRNA (uracil1939-C5)-methyltransferase
MSKHSQKDRAKITALSHEGRGIAHVNNKTTFILGALPGETVEFRYAKYHRQFDEGIAIRVEEPSLARVAARCEYFGVCGGCSLQHMAPGAQIQHKESVLLERLKHIGHAVPLEILPALRGEIFGYRNRARLSAHYRSKDNKVAVGFREQNSHFVTDINMCPILEPRVGNKIEAISQLLLSLDAKAKIPQIEIVVTDAICALVIRHLIPLSEADLKQIDEFALENNFHIYLQPKGNESVYLRSRDPSSQQIDSAALEYHIEKHQVRIQFQPLQFTQINSEMNLKMVDRAIELLAPTQDDRILDLFCGVGNFTLPLARYAGSVVGVEGDSAAVSQAQKNAELNGITNAEFFTANLFDNSAGAPWAKGQYDKILLDPPRAGAQEIIPLIAKFQPSRIVYVSCHTATLARDVKHFLELGYTLEKAGVMDMFPHTQHAEAIALLTAKKHEHSRRT